MTEQACLDGAHAGEPETDMPGHVSETRQTAAPAVAAKRIYVDHTHIRGHVTGIERVALDLFDPARLAPHEIRPIRGPSVPTMILAQQLGLPLRVLFDRSAKVIFPGFPPGPLALALRERAVIYVHDTFLLTRQHELNWRARAYMAPCFALALRFGRLFLVNSQTTAADVRRFCSREATIALLRPAVRDVFGLADLPGPASYRPGEPLRLLAIGTIEPRKDYPAAIALVDALNRAGMPAELHIVGRVGWGRHDFLETPPPFLKLRGYVDDAGLRALASQSHALISTAKAEGLGLPLLEIQHGGLPVIAPSGPVFSEVLGSSGLFIAPDDPQAAASAVATFAQNGTLATAAAGSRPNVARWNDLAARDAVRFREFLDHGSEVYRNTGT